MFWSRDEVTVLLKQYRKWPNLFKIKSATYKNRYLRKTALQSIQVALEDVKPGVSISEIQTKFQSLKQHAVREFKKHLHSKKSGVPEEEIYRPSLWYFEIISYVFEHSTSQDVYDGLENVEKGEEQQEDNALTMEEVEELEDEESIAGILSPEGILIRENSPGTSMSSEAHTPEVPKKRRKNDNDSLFQNLSGSLMAISQALIKSSPAPAQVAPKTASESFGEYVAVKLNRITSEEVRDEVEEEIVASLHKALQKCRELNKK